MLYVPPRHQPRSALIENPPSWRIFYFLSATLILLLRIMSANCRYPPLARFPSFVNCSAWYVGLSFVCCAMRQHRVYVNCPACYAVSSIYAPHIYVRLFLSSFPRHRMSASLSCARCLRERVFFPLILSEIHHPPYLSMTER